MVRLTVLMALFWSTDWMCMVTIWLESISRKSFRSWSTEVRGRDGQEAHGPIQPAHLEAAAVFKGKHRGGQWRPSPTRPPLGEGVPVKLKLFPRRPCGRCGCISLSRSFPFRGFAVTPSRWKLLSRSFWNVFQPGAWPASYCPASMPKVINLVLVKPLLPLASC